MLRIKSLKNNSIFAVNLKPRFSSLTNYYGRQLLKMLCLLLQRSCLSTCLATSVGESLVYLKSM